MTSHDARDARIRQLHDRRHELQSADRCGGLPAEFERELDDVFKEIDRLEMEEYNERERPHWEERFRALKAIADRIRPRLSPEDQAELDAVFAENTARLGCEETKG